MKINKIRQTCELCPGVSPARVAGQAGQTTGELLAAGGLLVAGIAAAASSVVQCTN